MQARNLDLRDPGMWTSNDAGYGHQKSEANDTGPFRNLLALWLVTRAVVQRGKMFRSLGRRLVIHNLALAKPGLVVDILPKTI